MTFADNHRGPDWEVEREPTLHAWGVLARVNAVEHVLVELSGEVACKSMDFGLGFLDSEVDATILPQRLFLSLRQVTKLINVRVRQVSEREHILTGLATWVSC